MQIAAVNEQATVVAALKTAAAATGSDFHYLLGTAMRESSLKPLAQSRTSSALGLFQFLDQTWLGLVKEHGGKYGLGGMASQIAKDGDRYRCDSETDRQDILALRKNPQISAFMAGEYAKDTAGQMKANLGRGVCGGELYAAHFLGPDAACRLIRLNNTRPEAQAATLFPRAADSNKAVFFHSDGAPKSVREVYDWAMRQPGAPAPAVTEPAGAVGPNISAPILAANAVNLNAESLLAMNWQPQGFFHSGAQNGKQLSLGAGLLDILSSMKS